MGKYFHPMMTRQEELEEAMAVATREAFWKEVNEARAQGRESETGYGRHILKHSIIPCADAIRVWMEEATSGKAGRRHSAVKYLEQIDPEVAAYLAMKAILDGITKDEPLVNVALTIGGAIEDEVRFRKFEAQAKEEFKLTQERIKQANARERRYKKTLMRLMANRNNVSWDDWPKQDKLHLGKLLVELMETSTGLVEIKRVTTGPSETRYYITPTEKAIQWIDEATSRLELLAPQFWPMVCPPKRWTNPWNGGYWTNYLRRLPLVKTGNRRYLEELAEIDMPEVYEAINAMQETPWCINARIMEALRFAIDTNLEIGKLPPADDLDLPPKPTDIATNEENRREWRKAAAKVYRANLRIRSKRIQVRRTLRMAEQFSEYRELYFPYQLDFRGRAYAVPLFLNPQGPDYAKALLTFAKGKPINDATAAGWLAIHGANCFGFDKVSLEDRIGWVEERNDLIRLVDADPWSEEALAFWTQADKPWQFLAFCFEWAGFLTHGYGFVSSLPIHLDGSCNGLQHYSAALRDPEGGRAVNLIPSELPQDIYGLVAEKTMAHLRLHCSSNGTYVEPGSEEWLAAKLLEVGINRKVTKKAVMCLPYGLSQFSARDYVEEGLRDVLEGQPSPFAHVKLVDGKEVQAEGYWEAAFFLTPIIWKAIGETVKGARVAMDWLQGCAKLAASEGLPVTWTTPDGFYVEQRYNKLKARRVKTVIDGETVWLNLSEELPEIDKRKMGQAIAPNWVHSMDATALRQFVVLAKDNGIKHFALVHDSYGTVAADVELMGQCLRKAFVLMYEEHDVLAEFREEIIGLLSEENVKKLPEVPEKGDLDIRQVEDSDFFFA